MFLGLIDLSSVSAPLCSQWSPPKEITDFPSKDLIGKESEDPEFTAIQKSPRLKANRALVRNIQAQPDVSILINPGHPERDSF